MNTVAQRLKLTLYRLPAVDWHQEQAPMPADTAQLFGHLQGQFPRRGEDDGLRHRPLNSSTLDEWNAKSGGLASAGEGLGNNVPPGDKQGYHSLLYRSWLLEAHLLYTPQHIGAETQLFETSHNDPQNHNYAKHEPRRLSLAPFALPQATS